MSELHEAHSSIGHSLTLRSFDLLMKRGRPIQLGSEWLTAWTKAAASGAIICANGMFCHGNMLNQRGTCVVGV